MKPRNVFAVVCTFGLVLFSSSCERDFFIELKNGDPELIVEAYINNELPEFNYVVLTHSQSYYETGFQAAAVSGADVTVTEGTRNTDGTYEWDAASKKHLFETQVPNIPGGSVPGVYLDTLMHSNRSQALIGKPGKHYLLEIHTKGSNYSSITSLPQPVKLDSITPGNYFIDSLTPKARLTLHYKDPDTIGNRQLYYWRTEFNHRSSFGWGAFGYNRFVPGTDDLTNGEYITITPNSGFGIGDTVHYHLVSVEKNVYKFWDSFSKARDNGGPFSTPVKLESNVEGPNVTGCFSGFSLSTQSIIVK